MDNDLESKISDAVRASLAKRMDDMLTDAIFGTTSQQIEEPTTLNAKTFLEDCEKFLRNARREQITFIVGLAHEGPILAHETPCDGKRVEMSWRQAQELYQHWPLRLHKVLEPTVAEFVPVSGVFPEFVPRVLPMPPFPMQDDDISLTAPTPTKNSPSA